MLEKLGFQSLVEETLTSKRIPRAMDLYRFLLGIVLGLYIGFHAGRNTRLLAEYTARLQRLTKAIHEFQRPRHSRPAVMT